MFGSKEDKSEIKGLVKNLVNGTVGVTIAVYYVLPAIYVMGMFLSFCMCPESTENFVSGMAIVKHQTVNIVGFIFCLKMCRPDAADHIAADPVNSTHVAPADE